MTDHSIDRILEAVAARPWFIEDAYGKEICAFLAMAAKGERPGWEGKEPNVAAYSGENRDSERGTVHVLKLHGTIMPRGGMLSQMSGGASLEMFNKAFEQAASDKNAGAILIEVNSPGGAVDLVHETAERVYRARRADRPIVAHANTGMHSAAYWIGSAADEVVVTPSGMVGSIGVFGMHRDLTAAMEKAGIKQTVIKAGPRKAEGVDGLTPEALAHQQEQANAMYDLFVSAVARNRGVSKSKVRADPEADAGKFESMGGGRSYHAKDALRMGLVDRIETFEDTAARLVRGNRTTSTARARVELLG